ncbi:hypothetical protein [Nonomuraea sp. NEAU-A123]|uniref:hypothetical protein n=1 Tax=Nonomuraea sp. NEAU-A123 TaxID=2839649 RepID=UPI001BE44C3B|nr:hypothetical protein [Nonomuraea sp. NEAU-A123]MBT2232003.1 hypothetical protein [Nonomuraea sp. NEAU-A123]
MIAVARVFDGVRDGVPYFEPGHPLVENPRERERLAGYLEAGTPILATTGLDVDRVEPERGEVVPLSFRTDGTYVWTDTVAYYLRAHHLRPDPELCAHIAAGGYVCPEVGEDQAARVLQEFYRFSAEPG